MMGRYLLRRAGLIVLTLILSSLVIFTITQLLPGDIARVMLGQFATEEAIANLTEELGLNRPIYVQYFDWLIKFVQGDWGISQMSRQPVYPLIMQRLKNSGVLAGLATLIHVPIGVILGVVAARRKDKVVDQAITTFSMVTVAIPEFVTALLLIPLLSHHLEWFPANSSISPGSTFAEAFPYLILPAIVVSLTSIGYITKMTRAGTIDVLESGYVRAAYLKGVPRFQVLTRHVLRNALLPTITVVAICTAALIAGIVVVEMVFGYPGMGRLLVYSIENRDLPLIQAVSMIFVIVLTLANLIADILYSLLNPRIRLGK
jgi:peptide/nickel transport system permease protein